ncbi:DUF1559 family PulG-like putative transporter [Candidatus Laterigemmans baculatus]|uniref:DUF1559 family PulG-like putative transporter n=1 Tax=Candidatus Laterigemmans baculatus TaxID=2770505 RepID=UPI0013DD4729|nr:DUF1559 domain-containing protein [Candidatus Laterigemmans baculatus]
MSTSSAPSRRAFAFKELLVVLVLLAFLGGIMFPAIQRLRESSRQNNCVQNLTQIGVGLASYSASFNHFPAGSINPTGPIRNEPSGFHHNWIGAILPSLDYPAVHAMIDPSVSVYAVENADAMQTQLPVLRCPSATTVVDKASNYAGVHHPTETPIDEDNLGMLILNRTLSVEDVPDGLGATLLVGEKLDDDPQNLGWLSGTRATLRNLGHPLGSGASPLAEGEEISELFVGGFASEHPSGVNFLHGDGSVRVMAPTTDSRVLTQLADRRDSPDVSVGPSPAGSSPAGSRPESAATGS